MNGGRVEIRIRGHIDDDRLARLASYYDDVTVTETVLAGQLPDQAALHGVLARLEELGCVLIEVRSVPRGRA